MARIRPTIVPVLFGVLLFAGYAHNAGVEDGDSWNTGYACEGSELQIRCAEGTVIQVINANYGRLDAAICSDIGDSGEWNLRCITPESLNIVRARCESASSCSIAANSDVFNHTCNGDVMSYLEVEYTCRDDDDDVDATTTTRETVAKDTVVTETATSAANEVSVDYCNSTMKRDVTWPATAAGGVAIQPCPNNPQMLAATWRCSSEKLQWAGHPDLSQCVSQHVANLALACQQFFDTFTDSPSALSDLLVEIVNTTRPHHELYGGDLRALIAIMADVVNRSTVHLLPVLNNRAAWSLSTDISTTVLAAGSHLLTEDHMTSWHDLIATDQQKTASQLVTAVETSAFMTADLSPSPQTIQVDHDNIVVKVDIVNTTRSADSQLVFPSRLHQQHAEDDGDEAWKQSLGFIRLSTSNLVNPSAPPGLSRVVFAAYNNLDHWVQPLDDTGSRYRVRSKVISASINEPSGSVKKLVEPVEFVLQHTNEPNTTNRTLCGFWKLPKNADAVGQWSSEGCETMMSNATHTHCQCLHLTHFGILMSVTGPVISDEHGFSLALITYCGCIISIICLILAFTTFVGFKNLQCDRNTIHKNLVMCLFVAESIFLVGIIQYDKPVLCSIVAGLLHYFFLTAFSWMCMEGVQLYVMLVEVFEAERSRVRCYYIAAYGVPAIVVSVSAAANYHGYGTPHHCWMTVENGFIWAFVGPVVLILSANLVMLGIAIYTMCRHAHTSVHSRQMKQKTKLQNIATWMKGAFVLVVLLGLTWMFGLFYIDSQSVFMAYIFTLLNSLQGLFIFVFHCLMSDKVQKEYRKFIYRTSWLPAFVRIKFGAVTGSVAATSVPNQSSSSSTGKVNYITKIFRSRSRKTPTRSSVHQKQPHSDDAKDPNKVLIVVTSPEDVELRCKKQRAASSSNSSNRLTESTTCNNTEDPSAYLEPTLCNINEADFFPSSQTGDVSVMDDSIADAIDFRPKRPGSNNSGMNQRTDAA